MNKQKQQRLEQLNRELAHTMNDVQHFKSLLDIAEVQHNTVLRRKEKLEALPEPTYQVGETVYLLPAARWYHCWRGMPATVTDCYLHFDEWWYTVRFYHNGEHDDENTPQQCISRENPDK